MTENIAVYAPERDFVLPYITAAVPDCGVYSLSLPDGTLTPLNKKADGEPALYIMISSVDIYGDGPADNVGEDAPTDTSSTWFKYEKAFTEFVKGCGHVPVVLRCADIVATGMTGFPRHLVETIWRGTFFHFPGNETRRSVVHAVDTGRIVRQLVAGGLPHGESLIYNVTDGIEPTIHDFAEALAYRLSNKRISNLSTGPQQWLGRKLYGPKKMALYTTNRTFNSEKIRLDLAFRPTDTCEYLRTHKYDENSL